MPLVINLDVMLAKRKITVAQLAELMDIAPTNLHIFRAGKSKALRLSSLEKMCEILQCQPSDIIEYRQEVTPWIDATAFKKDKP